MLEYRISADFDEWEKVSHDIMNNLEKRGFEESKIISVMVAAEEIFVNISEYAYGNNSGSVIIKTNIINSNTLQIDFFDFGIRFNPLEAVMPDIKASAKQREIGGLGIYMARQKTDQMTYEYVDNKNHLTIIKEL